MSFHDSKLNFELPQFSNTVVKHESQFFFLLNYVESNEFSFLQFLTLLDYMKRLYPLSIYDFVLTLLNYCSDVRSIIIVVTFSHSFQFPSFELEFINLNRSVRHLCLLIRKVQCIFINLNFSFYSAVRLDLLCLYY